VTDRELFLSTRKDRWDRLETCLRTGMGSAAEWSELAALYRAVCADLATAQSQSLPSDVLRYLDDLAGRAHNALYGARAAGGVGWIRLIAAEFPRTVRQEWRFFWVSAALFVLPLIVGMVGTIIDASFATFVLPDSMLADLEHSWSQGVDRSGSEDAMMAGFYVRNNVGIAFRCFATGALAGLGPVFYLVYNGLVIGTVAGYVTSVGHGESFLNFVAGHSSWELIGIVVSGAAGLKMGWAMVVTHGRTRVGSLRAAAPALYRLIVGVFVMLLVAAAIEGFWSGTAMPTPVKVGFGGLQFAIVGAWLLLGGRGRSR